MNELSIVNTGDVLPTCGPGQVHTPLFWDFAGSPVRVIVRPNQPVDRSLGFVRTDVAKALGYKNPSVAGESIGLIEGQDAGHENFVTSSQVRNLKVLTFRGLSKLLMRSSHEKAAAFQDWLASKSSDLAFHGIAFRDKSAQEGMADNFAIIERLDRQSERLDQLTQSVSDLAAAVLAISTRTEKVRMIGARSVRDLPLWNIAEHKRMRKLGYITSAEVLAYQLQRKPTAQESSGLSARTMAYCRAHDLPINYFCQSGRTKVYLPQVAAELVHRTGWSTSNQVMAEAQESLLAGLKVA